MKLHEALTELRKTEKRKFSQSVDFIINLKGIDLKRDQLNIVVNIPHKIKGKKVCAFLKEKSKIIDTITEAEFQKYKDKKPMKELVKKYDYFIAIAPLMPKVAMTFGKILGPAGKMPSPQLGILNNETDAEIKKNLEKIATSLKIRLKEPSIKLSVGNEEMKDEEIINNITTVYTAIKKNLSKRRDNIRNLMIKFSMTKPVKVEM